LRSLVLALALAGQVYGSEPVSIAAGADKDYVVQKFGRRGEGAKEESYFFAKGSYFGGAITDGSLGRVQFSDIVHELAADLASQRYFPSREPKNADLLIVVHWGMTGVENDATNGQASMDLLNRDVNTFNSGLQKKSIMDPGYVGSDLSAMSGKSATAGTSLGDNASLVGYTDEFKREEDRSLAMPNGMTEEDHQLREDLSSERYFVILMAYDYRSLLNGRRNGTKPKLVWSMHMSISAIGENFKTALPAMGRIAAGYFGHQVDGVLLNIHGTPAGKVEIGIPKTVEDTKAN
jgi:hypothetical protein